MRRHYRALVTICLLAALAAAALSFQSIRLAGFERGGDTPLGLKLGLDLQGGIHLVYQARLEDPATGELTIPTPDQMNALKASIERRVNTSGLGEPIILILGEDRLLVQLPGVEDSERAKRIIGETARLEFKHRTFDVPQDIEGIAPGAVLSARIEDRIATTTVEAAAAAATTTAETATSTPELVTADPTPVFVLELAPEAAAALDAEIASMGASLDPLPGSGEVFADFLVVSAEGGPTYEITSRPAIMVEGGQVIAIDGPGNIERVEGTGTFRVLIPPYVATSTPRRARSLRRQPPGVAHQAVRQVR